LEQPEQLTILAEKNVMKKILEVLQYGEMDIRFNTDIDVDKNPEVVLDIVSKVAFSMATKLWGGNELSVLAMIRALSIADLALSVNRKEMIKELDRSSETMARTMKMAAEEFRRNGGKLMTFGPGIMPGKTRS
jgi:hypothetical protein